MQRTALKEYAEANGYIYLKTFAETQTAKKGIKITMPKLMQALELCKKRKATFLYVDLRNWRRSPSSSNSSRTTCSREPASK